MPSYSFQGTSREWVPRDEEENLKIFGNGRLDGFMPTEIPERDPPDDDGLLERERWSATLWIKLLRLYGSHRCLWDHKDQFNKNRNERKAAMIDITAAMGDGITMDQISQKINVIRSTYRYEKRRIKQRIRKGQGANTKLKWFALADSFLRHVPRSEKFRKLDIPQDSDSDLEDAVVFTIDPEIMIPMDEDLVPGNQNFITIGPELVPSTVKVDTEGNVIRRQVEKINKILDVNQLEELNSKDSIKFLNLYKAQKCLYDTEHTYYDDKKRRNKAISKIVKEMGKKTTKKQVIRRIEAFRHTYSQELCIERSEERQWKWFLLADSFLRPFCEIKNKTPELEYSDNDDNEQSFSSPNSPYMEVKIEINDDSEATKDEENCKLDFVETIPKITIKPIVRKWSESDSLQFVQMYQEHRCLWVKEYHSRMEKSEAIENIAKQMDWPAEKIEKKVKIFKKAYDAEHAKRERAGAQGVSFKSEYVWFELADSFLAPVSTWVMCNPTHFVNAVLPMAKEIEVTENSSSTEITREIPTTTSSIKTEFADTILDLNSPMASDHFDNDGFSDSDLILEMQPTNNITDINGSNSIKEENELNIRTSIEKEIPTEPGKITWQPPEEDLLEGKWSLKQSVKFLRLYGAHRCLWELNHPDYRNRLMREAAMTDIAAVMGHGLDMEFVNKKVKIFRITYMQERKRLVDLMKQNQEPEIQLKWFPLADCFLRPHIGLRAFKDTDPELPQFDYQYVYANLNVIDPELLNSFEGKGSQNSIQIGLNGIAAFPEPESDDDEDYDDEADFLMDGD